MKLKILVLCIVIAASAAACSSGGNTAAQTTTNATSTPTQAAAAAQPSPTGSTLAADQEACQAIATQPAATALIIAVGEKSEESPALWNLVSKWTTAVGLQVRDPSTAHKQGVFLAAVLVDVWCDKYAPRS